MAGNYVFKKRMKPKGEGIVLNKDDEDLVVPAEDIDAPKIVKEPIFKKKQESLIEEAKAEASYPGQFGGFIIDQTKFSETLKRKQVEESQKLKQAESEFDISTLDGAIKNGLLPDSDQTRKAFETGKYTVPQLIDGYNKAILIKKYGEKDGTEQFKLWKAAGKELLQYLVLNDAVPSDKNTIDILKLRPDLAESLNQKYTDHKARYPDSAHPEYIQDQLETLKSAKLDTDKIEKVMDGKYNVGKYIGQEALSGVTFGIYHPDNPQLPRSKSAEIAGQAVNFASSLPAFMAAEFMLFGKGAVGISNLLTRGGAKLAAEESLASKGVGELLKLTGKVFKKSSSLTSKWAETIAAGKQESVALYDEARAMKAWGKAFEEKGLYEAQANLLKMKAEALGKDVLKTQIKKTAFEQGVIGTATGAVKGTAHFIKSDHTSEDFIDSLAVFAVEPIITEIGGLALSGLSAGVGKALDVKAKFAGDSVAAINQFAKEKGYGGIARTFNFRQIEKAFKAEEMAFSNGTVLALANRGLSPGSIKYIESQFLNGTMSERGMMAINSLEKINRLRDIKGQPRTKFGEDVTGPEMFTADGGKFFKFARDENLKNDIEMLTKKYSPEELDQMAKIYGDDLKKAFKDGNSPLNAMYEASPEIKTLVDQGQYHHAADMIPAMITQQMKNVDGLSTLMAGPLNMDAKLVNKFFARRVANMAKYSDIDNMESLVFNYIDDPSAATMKPLTQATKAAKVKSPVFTKGKNAGELRPAFKRLSPAEVNTLVNEQVGNWYKILSGEKVDANVLGSLADADSLARAVVTHNEKLNRSFMDSFLRTDNNFFSSYKGKLRDPMETAWEIRYRTQELTDVVQAGVGISKKLAEMQRTKNLSGIETLQNEIVRNRTKQTDIMRKIGELKTKFSSLDPLDQKEATEIVGKMYMPTRKAISKLKGEEYVEETVESFQKYKEKFFPGGKDAQPSPFVVNSNSELADELNAMAVTGHVMKNPGNWSMQSLTRKFENEYGFNNVFERALLRPYKIQTAKKNMQEAAIKKELSSLGVQEGSDISAKIQEFGEMGDNTWQSHQDFLSLPNDVQEKISKGIEVTKGIYNRLIDELNETNAKYNLPLINKRNDYFHHFDDIEFGYKDMVESFFNGNLKWKDDAAGINFGAYFDKTKKDARSNTLYFAFQRTGNEYKKDAVGGLLRYLGPALERIHYTDLVNKVFTVQHFADIGEEKTEAGTAAFLNRFKDEYLLGKPSPFRKAFDKNVGTNPWLKGFAATGDWFTKKLGEGQILYNLKVLTDQFVSAPLAAAAGGKEFFQAVRMMNTDGAKKIFEQSINKKGRDPLEQFWGLKAKKSFSRMLFGETRGHIFLEKKIGAPWRKHGEDMMNFADETAAKTAYLTGFLKAKKAGLNDDQAHRFADKVMDMIHADMSKVGRMEATVRSPLAKWFLQFSSFSNNLAMTFMNDLPKIAGTDGGDKVIKALTRTYAAMTMVNTVQESLGLPQSFEPDNMIPYIGNFKFGVGGILGFAFNIGKNAITESKYEESVTSNAIEKTIYGVMFPGSGQVLNKAYPALENLAKGKYDDNKDQFLKDFVYGDKYMKYEKKKKPSFLNAPVDKMIRYPLYKAFGVEKFKDKNKRRW